MWIARGNPERRLNGVHTRKGTAPALGKNILCRSDLAAANPSPTCGAPWRGSRHGKEWPMELNRGAFNEVVTLRQAKKLIQCMAHEQSFLLLSAPGMGKSEMVYEAARE